MTEKTRNVTPLRETHPWGTRATWRKLDCLNPNLQKMQWSIRRKDA